MEYAYKATIHMADTDATGALYFTALMRLAAEGFEKWLMKSGVELAGMGLPIVHAEADYSKPLRLWNDVLVHLKCSKVGFSSFTIDGQIGDYGKTRIIHVAVDSAGHKCSIPDTLKNLLVIESDRA